MNKPTDLEVNEKLAAYEGKWLVELADNNSYIQDKYGNYPLYTESLDAQAPIYKKLGYVSMPFEFVYDGRSFTERSAYELYYAILESEK